MNQTNFNCFRCGSYKPRNFPYYDPTTDFCTEVFCNEDYHLHEVNFDKDFQDYILNSLEHPEFVTNFLKNEAIDWCETCYNGFVNEYGSLHEDTYGETVQQFFSREKGWVEDEHDGYVRLPEKYREKVVSIPKEAGIILFDKQINYYELPQGDYDKVWCMDKEEFVSEIPEFLL